MICSFRSGARLDRTASLYSSFPRPASAGFGQLQPGSHSGGRYRTIDTIRPGTFHSFSYLSSFSTVGNEDMLPEEFTHPPLFPSMFVQQPELHTLGSSAGFATSIRVNCLTQLFVWAFPIMSTVLFASNSNHNYLGERMLLLPFGGQADLHVIPVVFRSESRQRGMW